MQLPLQSTIPDWAWIALVMGGLFVFVYTVTRRQSSKQIVREPSGGAAAAALTKSKGPASTRIVVVDAAATPTTLASPVSPPRTSSIPPKSEGLSASPKELPRLEFEDEDEIDPTKLGMAAAASGALGEVQPVAKRIVYDEDAAVDEKTHGGALILVTGTAQTDKGLRRQRNEDAILVMSDEGVYAVADGMGGHRGGEIASSLAVQAIEQAFRADQFAAKPHDGIPRRASELARAIQMANVAILRRVAEERELSGMGTTVCAARFSSNKQRLYVGHVGDSRMYRLREGRLAQLTADHTMGDLGIVGEAAAHLSRAVGIWPTVPIDIVLCKPRPKDLYLLCSDGLTKMVSDQQIGQIMNPKIPPVMVVEALIDAANAKGGKDNISAIVIRVDDAVTSGVAA
jgi:PPM family protein phosphatase